MENIKNYKNGSGYNCYLIETDNGSFEIRFENNLDLYWICNYSGNMLECPDSYEFLITKENYYLYSLFYKLYESVENNKPFMYLDEDVDLEYDNSGLYKDKKIKWVSDDGYINDASFVSIEKSDECFKVVFNKGKMDFGFLTYNIRFRTSGSRYGEYFIPFIKMYQDLEGYEDIKDQIHIEEYVYNKVRKRENV